MNGQVRDWSAVTARLDAVEGRNRKLSRQVRGLRTMSVLGLAVIGALLLTAAAVDEQTEVKAERFVLVDAQGRECGLLTASGRGTPALMLYDTKGTMRIMLEAGVERPCLQFFDATGKVMATLPERPPLVQTTTRDKARSWGPEQAAGAPDTKSAGDNATAWASKTADGQDEWLVVEYDEAVTPAEIKVYETYNPGALYKVSIFDVDGNEVEVWTGEDPTSPDSDKGVSSIKLKTDIETKRVKLYLKSSEVAGWNEIDAVGLVDTKGKTHWAVAAAGSSRYGE